MTVPTVPPAASTVITKPNIEHAFLLPLDQLQYKTLFQGAAVARDPSSGKWFLFQLQARPTGPGDVEDSYASRYLLDLKAAKLTYIDTMIVKRAGHIQSFRVRISMLGNPWLWMGTEVYDEKNNSALSGYLPMRIMYRKGTVELDGTSSNVERLNTGPGSAQIIGSEDPKTVWVRRPTTPEVYQEYAEDQLRAWNDCVAGPTQPLRTITMTRGATTYQSACATLDGEILRVNGGNTETKNDPSIMFSSLLSNTIDISKVAPPGLKVVEEEVESVFTIEGQAYIGKRYNSPANRVVSFSRVG